MAEKNNCITVGKDCEECAYCEMGAKNTVKCTAKNKTYYFGQYVPCEEKKKK